MGVQEWQGLRTETCRAARNEHASFRAGGLLSCQALLLSCARLVEQIF